jgi:hypothetical protein
MSPLPPNLDRLGDDLQAAAERAIAARRARRAAVRRGIVVALVAVAPAVHMMTGNLAPLHPASSASLIPQVDLVWDDLATDEASVAAGTGLASYPQRQRQRQRLRPPPVGARAPHLGARWNRPLGEPRARLRRR